MDARVESQSRPEGLAKWDLLSRGLKPPAPSGPAVFVATARREPYKLSVDGREWMYEHSRLAAQRSRLPDDEHGCIQLYEKKTAPGH